MINYIAGSIGRLARVSCFLLSHFVGECSPVDAVSIEISQATALQVFSTLTTYATATCATAACVTATCVTAACVTAAYATAACELANTQSRHSSDAAGAANQDSRAR